MIQSLQCTQDVPTGFQDTLPPVCVVVLKGERGGGLPIDEDRDMVGNNKSGGKSLRTFDHEVMLTFPLCFCNQEPSPRPGNG